MKKLLLVITSLVTLQAQAQTSVYFPFPDSAAVWRQEGFNPGNCCCSGIVCLKEDDYNLFLAGDTVIGSYTYKKIFKTGNSVEHIVGPFTCPPGCTNEQYYYYGNVYMGCLRQDIPQKKVFYVQPGYTQDTLLYDFNLAIGDTLPPYLTTTYPVYVTAMDSVLVGGLYHKRFEISGSGFPNEITLIEGIGNSLGLLTPFISNLNVSMYYNMLLCVTVNGVTIYPDTATGCSLASQINEINEHLTFSIHPNPFSEKLNFELDGNSEAEFFLYDVSLKLLDQEKFTGTGCLNAEGLSRGVYIYEVRDRNGLYKRGKVMKD
jgi:hypothetical protein